MKYKEQVKNLMNKYNYVGVATMVMDNNNIYTSCNGYSDLDKKTAITEDSIFRIASISKVIVALGIMKLYEEHKVDIKEDISVYLGYNVRNPHFPCAKITLEMLMTQTSSISDGADNVKGYDGVNGPKKEIKLRDLLTNPQFEYYLDKTFNNVLPGSTFEYSKSINLPQFEAFFLNFPNVNSSISSIVSTLIFSFQLIDKAMKYLVENLRWRVEMSDDNIHRNEIPEIPIEALREIVVNSFTHARYDIQIQHEIDIFSDRVAVSNPGSFANDYDPEDFAMSNMNSFLRNEKIAKVLYLCKDVESFGTGFNKIYSLCKKANVKLGYNKYDEYFNFIFYREDRNVVTNVVTNVVLNDNEKRILELLRNDNALTASKISKMINQSSRNIQRIMDSLRNKGLIERIGSNKSGYWNVK